MKTKFSGILTLLLAFVVQFTFAQGKTISGTISDQSGMPLPGVNIIVKNTTNGTQTDFDGKYNITANVGDVLVFTYVGLKTVEQTVGAANTIDVTMEEDAAQLDEVVVTGVAGATSRKKLSVTVAKVSTEQIEKVPAGSAASALQGKVAGVSVTNLGRPGQGATLLLRGAANFYGSQAPLVLLDGVFVEGGLGDINVDDIASFEIVKGASASSLYGSRAGNGVISITSKRGKLGKSEITLRSEVGFSKINNYIETNQSHGYELASDWEQFKGQYTKYEGVTYPAGYQGVWAASGVNAVTGGRIESADGYSDNPYGVYNNFQDAFFKNGINTTNYASISSGNDKSRVFFSSENTEAEGVLEETDGYTRNGLRLNADYYFNDWIKFTTSNSFIKLNDNSPGGGADIYRTIARLAPDAQLFVENPDGQPYWYKPDPWESEISNPLYDLYARDAKAKQQRFLGSYNLNLRLTDAVTAELEYAFESNNYRFTRHNKYETYTTTGDPLGFGYSEGSMNKNSSFELSQKAQATINYSEVFGDLEVKGKLSYLIEDRAYEQVSASGQNYLFRGLPTLDNFANADISASSNQNAERAQNMFVIGGLVYKDRYIVDALFRRDGSSLFGANERWNNYYRVSGAYRVTQDIEIPGVQELKLNFARGTSGQRPGFSWQYEQTALGGGSLSTNRIKGNPDLKPSLTTESEFGLNASFLDRFTLEAAYSNQVSSDQFMLVSLFAPANAGKNRQWQNVGDLESNTIEVSLNSQILDTPNVKWNLGVNFTTVDSKITKLNAPEQQVGVNGLFLLREGIEYGSMYGRRFVTDLATMANQLPSGMSIGDYSVNSDGVVVETSQIGTTGEAGIIEVDANGTPVFEKIGNQNADFNVGIVSNFSYKKLDFYMLWDWKQGGDIYNANGQWTTISERNAIVDQAGKPDSEKKTRVYYGSLYDVNQNNAFWVEDGSFVKLKEASVSYTFDNKQIPFLTSLKVSLIGRNLLTFSDYLGWDPEIANYDGGTQQYYSVDYGVYPNQSSYSMSVQIKF
ncbi:SusC/RagA family TonB-linked outer membrane protein [Flavobacteriaceae bacterium S0825]|uniref:SusC/RagA family TonB-linked outer membrane protein n=1 Tax=Gaetbulibacter sp. S0825 TaxID=2720084 RepID=UPI001430BD0C|nr:SusC/RagA family TonB-linked outer membrane protein [Gaetbulibacter sp. S0825]MCK0108774.1 SusC/RagA family TonB-linked outer membrane protein [Flavobacteriaceae bacterium S0825]NIX64410.1 SusC/RagA family TonB-linked outer membrane protein [Gaetbulibacter sp. S0825]